MSPPTQLVASLVAATEAAPDDVPLRLHLAEILRSLGQSVEAVRHCAAALSVDPGDVEARALMARLLGIATRPADPSDPSASAQAAQPVPPAPPAGAAASVGQDGAPAPAKVTLADVGGMSSAKERLEAAVLAPMRNPELRRLYQKSRTGGVLLYGPPGCGKTFLARAVAGELDARFLSVGFGDLEESQVEAEIEGVFRLARERTPALLLLDDIDRIGRHEALGPRRAASAPSVVRLAAELDRGPSGNLGVTIIGATSAPWNVDPVLRRPGRLERTVLVLPPDHDARQVILRQYLGDAAVAGADLAELALLAEGFSGLDIARVVRRARDLAGPASGAASAAHLRQALREVQPSTAAWLEHARSAAALDPDESAYTGLREYLRARPAR